MTYVEPLGDKENDPFKLMGKDKLTKEWMGKCHGTER